MPFQKFLREAAKLKDVERTGWNLHGVSKPESVGDHSWRTALLAWLYARKLGLDENKAVKMALVHDLPEVYTGDVATREDEKLQLVSNKEKHAREHRAMKKLFKLLPREYRAEFETLWTDVEEKRSPEGRLVNQLDKIEMVLQALDYEKNKRTRQDLSEFYRTTKARLALPELHQLLHAIERQRPRRSRRARRRP